jgi:hypothetical protein
VRPAKDSSSFERISTNELAEDSGPLPLPQAAIAVSTYYDWAMSFAGHSHFVLAALMGVWIAIVFVAVTKWTGASRRAVLGALVGGVAAGAVNIGTDSVAHIAGFWRYTEVTTPFGPLLYYLEAGLGCGALALVMVWLRRRSSQLAFLLVLAVYAPIRDWATARMTHLIEFDDQLVAVVVLADSLSSFVIPVLVAYGVVSLFIQGEQRRRQSAPS